jgi:hypothetical protein
MAVSGFKPTAVQVESPAGHLLLSFTLGVLLQRLVIQKTKTNLPNKGLHKGFKRSPISQRVNVTNFYSS